MLAQGVTVMEANHMHGWDGRRIGIAWAIETEESCMPDLWWIPIERLDGPSVGLDCILERWGFVLAMGDRLDVHVRVVPPVYSFRGLE